MKYLCTLFILIVSLNSCIIHDKKQNAFEFITPVEFIDNYNGQDPSIYDEIKFIKLETNNDFLLGDVKKLVVDDGFVYILTDGFPLGLYVFNLKGEAMFKVGKRGKGPGEYISISDFFIRNKTIYCSDPHMKLINRYDAKTGKFIDYYHSDQIIREIEGDDNYNYLIDVKIDRKDKSLCKVYDLKNKLRNEFLNLNSNSFIEGRQLYMFNKNIYLVNEVESGILEIKNGQTIHGYKFDFGKYNITQEQFDNLTHSEIVKKGIACEFSGLCVNDKVMIFNLVVQQKPYRLIYNIDEKKAVCYDLFKNATIESVLNYYQFANNEAVYCIAPQSVLKTLFDNAIRNGKSPSDINLPANIDIDDNPCLIIKTIKK